MNFTSNIALSLIVVALLSGCDLIETIAPCSDGHCRPPAESISEIQTLGVTIATVNRPFPETVDTDTFTRESDSEEFIFSNELDIFFSPTMTLDTVANPDSLANDWADHPYAFTFSKESGGAYEMIKPVIPVNAILFEGTAFSPLAVTNEPPELIVFGNHVLEATSLFPIRATHIEIWFRQERETEFTLMNRTSLNDLVAWKKYLQPAILEINPDN